MYNNVYLIVLPMLCDFNKYNHTAPPAFKTQKCRIGQSA